MESMEEVGYDDPLQPNSAAYNLGDLKREEEILISLYSKMKDQLHKLEVEELELKQKIRKKELNETTEDLFAPPALPAANSDADNQKIAKLSKGKGPAKRRRQRTRSASQSHDETASEFDESMSVTSALSLPSPARSIKTTPTPTRRSPRILKDSPNKLKAARKLTIPTFDAPNEPTLELDLSALNSMPIGLHNPSADFVESEDD